MNNINLLGQISFRFAQPLFLLIIIGAMILALIPYLRMKKEKRRTRNRIVSMIIHAFVVSLACMVLAGFTIHEEGIPIYNETFILIDVSDSTYDNSESMAKYANSMIDGCGSDDKVGVIVYGAGEPVVYKPLSHNPRVDVNELLHDYWDAPTLKSDGYIITMGTDIEQALDFTVKQFENDNLDGSRIIVLTDGMETDGSFKRQVESMIGKNDTKNIRIDAVYFKPKDYKNAKEMQIVDFKLDDQSPEPAQSIQSTVTVQSHSAGKATIKIYDYNKNEKVDYFTIDKKTPILTHDVEVKSETEELTLPAFTLTGSGVHTLVAALNFENAEDDSVTQNNYYLTYAIVSNVSNKILIIDGSTASSGSDSTALVNLLDKTKNPDGYDLDVVKDPAKAPLNLSDYGEVILVNCATQNAEPETRQKVLAEGGSFLPNGYDKTLNSFIIGGGGLLTTGGDKTYYNGGMYTGNYQDFLPISVKPEASGSKAVMICIDYSSGMGTGEGGGRFAYNGGSYTRIELVKMGIKKALDDGAFGENDYIGMLAFGGKVSQSKMTEPDANGNVKCSPYILLNLTNGYNVMDIDNALNKLRNDIYMGNTEWRLPMETAAGMLNKFNQAEIKHMLFITDGAGNKTEGESSAITNYPNGGWKQYNAKIGDPITNSEKCYTGYMYDKYGITTSTILINNNYQNVKNYVRKMAVDGGGIVVNKQTGKETGYADCTSPEQIAKAVEEACKNIPSKLINESEGKDFQIKVNSLLTTMTGVKDGDLPDLKSYNGATVKYDRGAYALLETGTDAVYAEWKYKNGGKVGSLLTDITNSNWDNGLMNTEKGKDVIKYMVKSCFNDVPGGLPTDMTVTFEQENFLNKITVSDIAVDVEAMQSFYHSPGSGVDPSIDSSVDTLCPDNGSVPFNEMMLAVDAYESSFLMKKEGLYTVAFCRLSGVADGFGYVIDDNAPYFYTTFSYSKEYDTFYDSTELFTNLGTICALTNGGSVYMGETDDIENSGEASAVIGDADMDKDYNPTSILMIIALLLFILDVIVRKFNFKWPHEWFKKKDTKRV